MAPTKQLLVPSWYTFELFTDSNVIYQIVLISSLYGQIVEQAVGLSDQVDASQIEIHANCQVLVNNSIQSSGGEIGKLTMSMKEMKTWDQ